LGAMRQAASVKADFTEEVLLGFLSRLCPTLNEQGDFYIQELSLENRPAAWLLTLRSDKGPMIYNTAMNTPCASGAPGGAFGDGHPAGDRRRQSRLQFPSAAPKNIKKRLGASDFGIV